MQARAEGHVTDANSRPSNPNGRWLSDLGRDVRYAVRGLRRNPGFTATALITIALGIGATTAVLTIVNGILLRPLPYPDADRLVRIYQVNREQELPRAAVSLMDFDDWRQQTTSFSSLTAYQYGPLLVTSFAEPVEVETALVAGDFFGTLRGSTIVGRPLQEDDVRRAVPNAVVSERLWRTQFSSDPRVAGRTVTVQGARTSSSA